MKIGVVLPAQELGDDPAALKDFAQGAEDLGFDYLQVTDHVVQTFFYDSLRPHRRCV